VLLGFSDQEPLARQVALTFGQPNIRWINTPRVGVGSERVAVFWDQLVASLTAPLTDKEKETGLYVPPPDPRICFTGTLDDAQDFYQKTTPIASCKNCPISGWTDGIPITIPTEEKVREMETGTSKSPESYISYLTAQTVTFSTSGIRVSVNAGDPVYFLPMAWGTTVEKIAVNAVMAGCTNPKCLPVLCAAYQSGSPFVTTNCPASYGLNISGPIVKDLELNTAAPFALGNPGLMSLGRAYDLMIINIGGSAQGSSNTNLGHPVNRTGIVCAEDPDSLPPGWEPNNTQGTVTPYGSTTARPLTASDSIIRTWGAAASAMGFYVSNFAPQAFTDLNQGKGPIARALGVEGTPGKYNILQYFIPNFVASGNGGLGTTMIMSPAIAQSLYDAGFTTKASISPWMSANVTYTALFYKQMGWFDFGTTGGTAQAAGTGLTYNQLPDSYLFRRSGGTVVVSNAIGDPCIIFFSAAGGTAKLIDAWY